METTTFATFLNYILKEAWGYTKEESRVIYAEEALYTWSPEFWNTVENLLKENPKSNLVIYPTTNFLKYAIFYRIIKKERGEDWKTFYVETTNGKANCYDAAKDFFMKLVAEKSETHELVPSCNRDRSMYLIPKGTIAELTYKGKPADSYRLGDHWHWYANLKKAPKETIQCQVMGMPAPAPRKGEKSEYAGEALWFSAVGYTRDGSEYELLDIAM